LVEKCEEASSIDEQIEKPYHMMRFFYCTLINQVTFDAKIKDSKNQKIVLGLFFSDQNCLAK
jgi:hypothetical protein